jgi:hypothetical protein
MQSSRGEAMKKIILFSILLLILISPTLLYAQWARTYGGSGEDRAYSIQQTHNGGYIVAGQSSSFSASYSDEIWVLKLSQGGDIEWQQAYGGDDLVLYGIFSIQQTHDGGYVIAASMRTIDAVDYNYDIWVLKLFSNGNIEWQRAYGGSGQDVAVSIQQTDDEGYIVAGRTASVNGYIRDFLVLKLFSNGNIEWQRTYGNSNDDDLASFVQQTFDGGYIIAGTTFDSAYWPDEYDIWIIKLTSSGDIEWQRKYGRSGGDEFGHLQQTADGGFIVAGSTRGQGTSDIWVLKLTSVGDIEWQRKYGGSRDENSFSIVPGEDGGYLVAGDTSSFDAEYVDIWIFKLDSVGDIEWEYAYGGADWDRAYSIQQTDDGGYIAAGGTASFSFPPLPHRTDMLILKLNPDGSIASSCDFIRSTSAAISDTDISPRDTYIAPQDTNFSYTNTNATPHVTRAIIITICVKYNLTISATAGGTTDPSPDSYGCYSGTEAKLEAIPGSGYEFNHWSGSASGSDNPITIIMDSDKSITANFQEITKEGKKGKCFIATAAFGSPLHPQVRILRNFRDRYLMPSRLGQRMVDFYYRHSPKIASLIAKHKALRLAARFSLLPFIAFSYSMLRFGPALTAAMLLVISAILGVWVWSCWRRLKRNRRSKFIQKRKLV